MSNNDNTSSSDDKGDREWDKKGHTPEYKKGQSLSPYLAYVLRSNPDRAFVVKDFVDLTQAKYDTVKRLLSRLASTGKGSGPVKRVAHGMYQYAPEKEQDTLQKLVQYGNWKIENLRFEKTVPSKAPPTSVSLIRSPENSAKGIQSDSRIPIDHPNVP